MTLSEEIQNRLREIRQYGLTDEANPPGIYRHRTVEWLAALPNGPTTKYWRNKRTMFPEMAEEQGRMNFPDLTEMRIWSIIDRHLNISWNTISNLWRDTADALETPYPFSDPRFLEDPEMMVGKSIQADPGRMAHRRLERMRESLTYRGNLPLRWDITKDLGFDSGDPAVIADPGILNGQAHILGTGVTLEYLLETDSKPNEDTREEERMGITPQQYRTGRQVIAVLGATKVYSKEWHPKHCA